MSINALKKVVSEYVPNARYGAYEFVRFDKRFLEDEVGVTKLLVTSASYSDWEMAADPFFQELASRQMLAQSQIYCFIVSPSWQRNTRVAKHYGLRRLNSIDLGIKLDKLLVEGEVVSGDNIIFYGVVGLTLENAKDLFRFVSRYESGILFSGSACGSVKFETFVEGLVDSVINEPSDRSFHLDVVNAINVIVRSGEEAILPYGWDETGEYHLDIFKKSK